MDFIKIWIGYTSFWMLISVAIWALSVNKRKPKGVTYFHIFPNLSFSAFIGFLSALAHHFLR